MFLLVLETFQTSNNIRNIHFFLFRYALLPAIIFAACDKKDQVADEKEFQKLMSNAFAACRSEDFALADEICHDALQLLKKFNDGGVWPQRKVLLATVYLYDFMGKISLSVGDYERAEKLFKECMKGCIQSGRPQDDDAIIELSMKLAMIYALQKKHDDADLGYNFCIDTQRKKLENTKDMSSEAVKNGHALLGMCLHSYGKYLIQNKKYKEAEEKIEESVALAKKYMGDNHPQVPVIYCDLANAAAMQGKYDYSLECLNKGRQLAKPDSVDMVWLLINQGPVEAKKNDIRSAKISCNKAKEIAQKMKHQTLIEASEECFKRINSV